MDASGGGTAPRRITVLGVGCTLFTDEGFGVHAVTEMEARYDFPDHVSLVDGGVLGLGLLGVITDADHLIVVDAVRNGGPPGTLYRLEGDAIPARIRAKNSLHQVDLLEALALCQALDHVPETVIIGVEPADIETLGLEMTPAVRERMGDVIAMVLKELALLGVDCRPRRVLQTGGGA